MSEPIRVGIIGLGRSGWSIHAEETARNPGYQLVAVADPEADRRDEARARFDCATYEDWPALIADNDVELVIVATPSHTHAAISCEASRAGRHVLVEKPMAASAVQADAMIASARENDRLLSVFQIRRVDPGFLKIREIIESGVLGPLQIVRIGMYSYHRRRDWQTLRKFNGGQLNNAGAHALDQLLTLAGGEWRDLNVDLRQIASAGDADDYARIAFTGIDGTAFQVEVTNGSAFGLPGWFLVGKYGAIQGEYRQLKLRYFDPGAVPAIIADEGPAAGRAYGSGEELPWVEETIDLVDNDSNGLFYDALYASIRQGSPLLIMPQESRRLIALMEACHELAAF